MVYVYVVVRLLPTAHRTLPARRLVCREPAAGECKKVKVKERIALYGEIHDRATERHLPYGITQCYLPPDTGERAPP